jgi:rod shape-determining protein MreD
LGLALVEGSWGRLISVSGVHPDLVFVAVISWAMLSGPLEGVTWALMGGLWLSLFSSAPFGLIVLPLMIVSLVAVLGHNRVYGGYLVLPVLLSFPLSLIYYLSYMLLLALFGRPMEWNATLLQVALPASALNVAGVVVLFPLFRQMSRRLGRPTINW